MIVLQHLLEQIDECVEQLDEYALVIADEVDEPAKHRAGLNIYRTVGTKSYKRRQLTRSRRYAALCAQPL